MDFFEHTTIVDKDTKKDPSGGASLLSLVASWVTLPIHKMTTSLLRSAISARRLWSKKAYGFRKWNGAHACISTIGHNASIDMDLPENFDRKTRIICTVGPSTWSKEGMHGLLQRGMNVLRLNFSHGTHEQKAEVIGKLRSLLVDIPKNERARLS